MGKEKEKREMKFEDDELKPLFPIASSKGDKKENLTSNYKPPLPFGKNKEASNEEKEDSPRIEGEEKRIVIREEKLSKKEKKKEKKQKKKKKEKRKKEGDEESSLKKRQVEKEDKNEQVEGLFFQDFKGDKDNFLYEKSASNPRHRYPVFQYNSKGDEEDLERQEQIEAIEDEGRERVFPTNNFSEVHNSIEKNSDFLTFEEQEEEEKKTEEKFDDQSFLLKVEELNKMTQQNPSNVNLVTKIPNLIIFAVIYGSFFPSGELSQSFRKITRRCPKHRE